MTAQLHHRCVLCAKQCGFDPNSQSQGSDTTAAIIVTADAAVVLASNQAVLYTA